MNKNKKGILLALCLVLAVPVCGSGLPAQATSMSSITSDSIREKQDQINQAQKRTRNDEEQPEQPGTDQERSGNQEK